MGQVIGETDSRAERSINGQISFQNIMSTIYHILGIDPDSSQSVRASHPAVDSF